MQTYRLYGLGLDGEVLFGEDLSAASQAEAVALAEQALTRAPRVELWQETIRIFHRRAAAATPPADAHDDDNAAADADTHDDDGDDADPPLPPSPSALRGPAGDPSSS